MTVNLREHILQHLVTSQAENRFGDAYLVQQVTTATRSPRTEVFEALWGLVGDGLIYLDKAGQSSSTDNWRWRPSQRGIQVATQGRWEPHDPDGYLRRLRRTEPGIDPRALVYLEEALRAFNAQCFLASSVMLGVASEQVVNELTATAAAFFGPTAEKLRKAIGNPRASQNARFEELRKLLESHRHQVPEGLADPLTLDAVTDLLRITRNAAGHPTGAQVDHDTAYTHLQMAAAYLAKMTRLAAHFSRSERAAVELPTSVKS
ncbi:hypothetical protein [Geodermatophilus sp. DSM 45219]|uniref:hypothetical protein n=1 Tax=Geodermatophilus sp. DSM 45219 TaxID=1881103 RepID=UPI0008876C69|nr:hypothetical protein [Geodermatophilus sp. DSM 45219]SDN41853.1 hypothetical protein SAMN05428965_0312 [Geodermatophilus sp. DSM 45219]